MQDNRVEIYIPRGYAQEEPNLFVSVNGVNYLLPKGKSSLVPREVALEVQRSWAAQEMQDRKMEQLLRTED